MNRPERIYNVSQTQLSVARNWKDRKMGYCYRVELTRRILEPFYGPEAYRNETRRFDFPFGKGAEFKTGKLAFKAANDFAISMIDNASSVSVWRLSGGKRGYSSGNGEYLKDDHDSRFTTGWTPIKEE